VENDSKFGRDGGFDISELRHEISIWQHAAASLSSYSKDEDLVRATLMKKVNRLLSQLKKKVNSGKVAKETYRATLQELTDRVRISFRIFKACVR
jgi:P protein